MSQRRFSNSFASIASTGHIFLCQLLSESFAFALPESSTGGLGRRKSQQGICCRAGSMSEMGMFCQDSRNLPFHWLPGQVLYVSAMCGTVRESVSFAISDNALSIPAETPTVQLCSNRDWRFGSQEKDSLPES